MKAKILAATVSTGVLLAAGGISAPAAHAGQEPTNPAAFIAAFAAASDSSFTTIMGESGTIAFEAVAYSAGQEPQNVYMEFKIEGNNFSGFLDESGQEKEYIYYTGNNAIFPVASVIGVTESNKGDVLKSAKVNPNTQAVSSSWGTLSNRYLGFKDPESAQASQIGDLSGLGTDFIGMLTEDFTFTRDPYDEGTGWSALWEEGDASFSLNFNVNLTGQLTQLDISMMQSTTQGILMTMAFRDLGTTTVTNPIPRGLSIAPLAKVGPAAWRVSTATTMKNNLVNLASILNSTGAKTPKEIQKAMADQETPKNWKFQKTGKGAKYIAKKAGAGVVSYGIEVKKRKDTTTLIVKSYSSSKSRASIASTLGQERMFDVIVEELAESFPMSR